MGPAPHGTAATRFIVPYTITILNKLIFSITTNIDIKVHLQEKKFKVFPQEKLFIVKGF